MTFRDILRDSMMEIGALSIGENPTADDLSTGLRTFNRMLGNWSIQNLMIYANTEETFPLVASQATYQMGPLGDFVTTRPKQIDRISLIDANSNEIPIDPLTEAEWQSIQLKSTSSEVPSRYFPNPTYPKFSITFWPIPSSSALSAKIYSLKPITKIAAAGDTIDFPDGYELAIVKNFAILLCPSYGRQASPELVAVATSSKADVKRANQRTSLLSVDSALVPRKRYNIYSGS